MAWTFAEGKAFQQNRNKDDSSAIANQVYLDIWNASRAKISEWANWSFERKTIKLLFAAMKSTGTVSINSGAVAVTGVGTAFATPADVGKFIRFAGEPEQYEVQAAPSATSLTLAENYLQGTNLAGGTYQLTQPAIALPARFRNCDETIYTTDGTPLDFEDLDKLTEWRRYERSVGDPYLFAIQGKGTGNVAPYLWVYPDPQNQAIIELNYYEYAPEATVDASLSYLPDVIGAKAAHQAVILAGLYEYQGKMGEAQAQEAKARQIVKDTFAKYMVETRPGQRGGFNGEYQPYYTRQRRIRLAPGE